MKSSGLTLALSLMLITQVAASADGLLTTFVKDTLQVTGNAVGGTLGLVGGTVGLAGDAVGVAGAVVSGTVDSVGNVIDGSGRIVGRVVTQDQLVTSPVSGSSQVITNYGGSVLLGNTNDVYSYSLDTRTSDLGRAVDAAESAGKITSSQAIDMRGDLARISSNEINAQSDHLFTFDESIAIARDLDKVNNRLATMLSVQPFGQLVLLDSAGNARMFVTTPRRGGTVTSTRTVSDINGVRSTTTVTSNTSPITSGALFSILDNRRYALDRMIGDAKLRNTIDARTAMQLQAKADHVRLLMLDRGHVLTQDQALTIARELDTLDSDVSVALKVSTMTPLTIVDTTSGTARIVSDQFGNVIALSDAGPDIYIKTLEGRRLELESTIAAGQASGTISAAQAQNLRAELDRVARTQTESGVTDFTYVNALPLAMSLDYVGNQLITYSPTITYVPLINGSRFAIIGGRVIMLDDVMVRRADLESKISRSLATNKISTSQANSLRAEMGRIAIIEKQMRLKGSFSFRESRELYNRFDRVGSRLDSYYANKSTPISSKF